MLSFLKPRAESLRGVVSVESLRGDSVGLGEGAVLVEDFLLGAIVFLVMLVTMTVSFLTSLLFINFLVVMKLPAEFTFFNLQVVRAMTHKTRFRYVAMATPIAYCKKWSAQIYTQFKKKSNPLS